MNDSNNLARQRRFIEKRTAQGDSRHTVWITAAIRQALEDRGFHTVEAALSALAQGQAVNAKDPEFPATINAIMGKLSNDEQALLASAVRDEVQSATAEQRARLLEFEQELDAREEHLKAMARGITAIMTEEEYRLIRGLLHPDRHPEDPEKYGKAFELFNRLEKAINPNIPIAVLRKNGWAKKRR